MPARRSSFVPALVLSLASAVTAETAIAQDRLFTATGFGAPAAEVGALGRFGANLGPRPEWVLGSFVAGGRFVVEDRGATLAAGGTERSPVVRSTFTGARLALPTGYLLAPDPIRPQVFLLRGSDVVSLDIETGVSRTLTTALPVPYLIGAVTLTAPPEAQLAQNAALLFVRRQNPAGDGGELGVVDVTTATVVRSLPNPSARYGGLSPDPQWLVDPDASRVFGHGGRTVDVMDAVSGATVARTPVDTFTLFGNVPFSALMPDWAHQRVLAVQGQPNSWTLSLVGASGALLLEMPQRGYCLPQLRVSPHTGRGYLLFNTGGGGKYYGPIFTSVLSFDAPTLAVLQSTDVTTAFGFDTDKCQGLPLSLVTAPGAPRNLTASVIGRDVALSWQNVGDATSFVLDVGLAPGRTDVSVYRDGSTTASFSGVPSGRFYVRVRGANAFGGGRPSVETVITVP